MLESTMNGEALPQPAALALLVPKAWVEALPPFKRTTKVGGWDGRRGGSRGQRRAARGKHTTNTIRGRRELGGALRTAMGTSQAIGSSSSIRVTGVLGGPAADTL